MGNVYQPVVRGKKIRTFWLDYSVGGRRFRESAGTTSKREAQQLLRERVGDRQSGKLSGRPDKVTLANLREGLERHYTRTNKRSWASAKYAFAHLERLLGPQTKVPELTTKRLVWYLDTRLKEGAKRATVRTEIAILNSAFTVAMVEDQVLTVRPTYVMPEVKNARSGVFSKGDYAALIVELPPLHRSIVAFAYCTGWRRGEILGLMWSQIDWENKTLRIDPPTEERRTKGEDARVIPFANTPLEDLLTERWKARDEASPFVFHRDGKRIRTFYKVWKTACKKAGLEGRYLHDFRRTAATELINADVPEKVVMEIVGWSTRDMLDRYHIVNRKAREDAMAKRFGKVVANTEPATTNPAV
jgi:integrase